MMCQINTEKTLHPLTEYIIGSIGYVAFVLSILGGWQVYVVILLDSVADPGCLSQIPDPDYYPFRITDPGSRITDPKTATKRGEKN
jgi:hypothetical protein